MKAFHKEWEQSLSLARFAQAFVSALEAAEVPEQTRTALAPIAARVGHYAGALYAFGKNGTALSRSQEIARILATLQAQKDLEWNCRFENLSSVH